MRCQLWLKGVWLAIPLVLMPAAAIWAVAAPTKLKVDQLHRRYTDTQHRYQLTVQGTGLAGDAMKFVWSTDCGQFYSQAGQALGTSYTRPATQWIWWGYDLPTDCTDAQVTVAIQEGEAPLVGTQMTQKVFFPESTPSLTTYQPRDRSEVAKVPWQKWVKIRVGSFWGWLKHWGRPEDASRDEVPGGVTGVRG